MPLVESVKQAWPAAQPQVGGLGLHGVSEQVGISGPVSAGAVGIVPSVGVVASASNPPEICASLRPVEPVTGAGAHPDAMIATRNPNGKPIRKSRPPFMGAP